MPVREASAVKQRILLVSIVRADTSISGLGFRFVGLWRYLRYNRPDTDVFLLTNKTLKDHALGDVVDENIFSFDDRGKHYLLKRLAVALWLLWLAVRLRVTSIHLVAGGADYIKILGPIFRLFAMKVCTTYATVSLDVTTKGDPKARRSLEAILENARNVDVLNPTHSLPAFSYKKFVSPCSFPWMLEGDKFPKDPEQTTRQDVIVFSGSLVPWKNPILAMDGFLYFLEKHNSEFPTSQLVMIGHGALEGQLRVMASAINARFGREAVFFGRPGSSLEYLRISKVFLSLQLPENYPSQSLMEAMLLCNHVVATDVGDTRLMVRPELGNRLVGVDVQSVGDSIACLLGGQPINLANRQLILKEHCVERFADYFLEMHQNLV